MRGRYVYLLFLVAAALYAGISYRQMAESETEVASQWCQVCMVIVARAEQAGKLAKVLEAKGFPDKARMKILQDAGQKLAAAVGKEELRQGSVALDNAAGSIFLVMDSYPAIQEDDAFVKAKKDMESVSEEVERARREYNAMVMSHNRMVKFYPWRLFAGYFGLEEKEYFRDVEQHKGIPKKLYGKEELYKGEKQEG